MTTCGVREARRGAQLSAPATSCATKALTDLADALGPDAYWRAPTWKRVAAIAAGPLANILLALVLFTGLYMTSVGKPTTTVDSTRRIGGCRPGLQAGDRIVSINWRP